MARRKGQKLERELSRAKDSSDTGVGASCVDTSGETSTILARMLDQGDILNQNLKRKHDSLDARSDMIGESSLGGDKREVKCKTQKRSLTPHIASMLSAIRGK
jgi:hypothetical protein